MSEKKVVALLASKRKKNTYALLNMLHDALEEHSVHLEIIPLFDYDIKDCYGCETCIYGKECIHNDGVKQIEEKLMHADGIVLASPVYTRNMTGRLKSLFDRLCRYMHRPPLIGIPLLSAVTTAGDGTTLTLKAIENAACEWGVRLCGRISRSAKNRDIPLGKKEYANFLNALFSDRKNYRPSYYELITFQAQKALAVNLLEIDYEYWKKNKLLAKSYFYKCKISPLKRIVSFFFSVLFNRLFKKKNTNI